MKKTKTTTDFALYVRKFLTDHLVESKNVSANTVISYRDTIVQLVSFLIQEKSLKIEDITISCLTNDVITEFLENLENSRNCSISTRNQRLSAIHSFFRYIGMTEPQYMFQVQQILSIPKKKDASGVINYLTLDETKNLLSAPDSSNKWGRRDQALLCLLYDSGCRVQELADITVKDLRLESPAQIRLTGKGRKTRIVPLMKETASILKNYIHENELDLNGCEDHPFFYNHQGKKLTRQGITYILKKYSKSIVQRNITPHSLRHSKAMHLTEADVNPIFIRDFLGHADLKTTQIYSKTSVEMKRKAIETISEKTPVPDEPKRQKMDWTEDKDLMVWLKSL